MYLDPPAARRLSRSRFRVGHVRSSARATRRDGERVARQFQDRHRECEDVLRGLRQVDVRLLAAGRHNQSMPMGADDPTDIAAIARDHLIAELELDQDFKVYATRVAVEHRDAGRLELWQETDEWRVVQPGTPAPKVLNWTTGRFEDLPPAPDHEAHRYLMPLSDAQQFAYKLLRDRVRSPHGARVEQVGQVDEHDD